jgi:hypothetical protein
LTSGLATAVDDLYRDVVMEPERWNESDFAAWLEGIALDRESIDRPQAKQLRAALRVATKLQRFWAEADSNRRRDEPSWRARVDVAVGVPAWRPGLELAMSELDAGPSEEGFEDVRRRFRVVHGTTWLEGTTYPEWAATIGSGGAR